MSTRDELLATIRGALEPLAYVQALYEGGAAAFGRLDELSDLDLIAIADESRIDDAFAAVEAALPMLLELARKEVLRGNPVDAAGQYHAMGVRPLVELLRMRHCPERYTFGLRYVKLDLPAEVNVRLEALCYPAGMEALPALLDEIEAWADELLAAL